jgi:Ribosomal L38e protein family
MPKELRSKADFEKLLESATEVRVSRDGDNAKVKLRTVDALYTLKTTSEEADSMIKGIKVPVVEF